MGKLDLHSGSELVLYAIRLLNHNSRDGFLGSLPFPQSCLIPDFLTEGLPAFRPWRSLISRGLTQAKFH
jgi:hypothetical protein